jgi:putative transposase
MIHDKLQSSLKSVFRGDILRSNLTYAKDIALRAVLRAYQKGAVAISGEQWRLFYEAGGFDRNYDKDKKTFRLIIGNANRVQMARYQVVEQNKSWISNRVNDFKKIVRYSSLSDAMKREMYVINKNAAWFSRNNDAASKLARSIMRHIMSRHRKPNFSNISMRLDKRCGFISRPKHASQNGRVAWWVSISTMVSYKNITVPLLGYDYHDDRAISGTVSNGVLISANRETGTLSFSVATDMSESYYASRSAYVPSREMISLDFGLSTLFSTNEGDLLGRNWLTELKRFDLKIVKIASGMQRHKQKPRQSRRYCVAVAAVRGWMKTEINRILNRLVALKTPAALILERLNFQNPALSRRLNRILQNCGRGVIRAKLVDLEDKFGISIQEVNPAYTSQTCSNSACGYIDKRNRKQSHFKCLWCGNKIHADCNAARNIGERRALSIGSVYMRKADVLHELIKRFMERNTDPSERPDDPRFSSYYFSDWKQRASKTPLLWK